MANPGETRRPLQPHELPGLLALGGEVRKVREAVNISRYHLCQRAELSEMQLSRIERAERRTRRSTLTRIARALVDEASDLYDEARWHRVLRLPPQHHTHEEAVEYLVDWWCSRAGVALAEESVYKDRVTRRRELRWLRKHKQARTIVVDFRQVARLRAEVDELRADLERLKQEPRAG